MASRLWPGELIFLTIQLDVQRNVLAVPNEAILAGQQGSYVYVVDAKNTAQTRNVVPSIVIGDLTVIAQGLTPSDRVVIDGQSRLNPGSHVTLLPALADTAGRSLSSTGNGYGVPGGRPAGGASRVTGVFTSGGGSAGGTPGILSGPAGAAATGQGGNVVGGLTTIRTNTPTVAPAPSMTGVTGTNPTSSPTQTPTPAPTPPRP
jgi:hypothetical protein